MSHPEPRHLGPGGPSAVLRRHAAPPDQAWGPRTAAGTQLEGEEPPAFLGTHDQYGA